MDNMDNNDTTLQEAPVCAKCKEHEMDVAAYEALVLGLAFTGPIVGMLIGLFAGKKLLGK